MCLCGTSLSFHPQWTRSKFFIITYVALDLSAKCVHDSETKVKSFHHKNVERTPCRLISLILSCGSALECPVSTWLRNESEVIPLYRSRKNPKSPEFFNPFSCFLKLNAQFLHYSFTNAKSFHHRKVEWTPSRYDFFIPSLVALHLSVQCLWHSFM